MIVYEEFSLGAVKAHGNGGGVLELRGGCREIIGKRLVRSNVGCLFIQYLIPVSDGDAGPAAPLGDIHSHVDGTGRVDVHVHRGLLISAVHMPKVADSIPVGGEFLGLLRVNPAVVRLVVGVGRCHKLHIGAVGVRKGDAVPHVAVGKMAPGPELAALVDVVVSGKHGSGVFAVVVTAYKIVLEVLDENGVSGEGRQILPPAHVNADEIRIPFIRFVGYRPVDMAGLVVEHAEFGCLRENDLVVLVGMCSHIVPVQHGIAVLRIVEETARNLYVGLVRIQGEAYGPAHAVTLLNFSNPDGLGAVSVVHQRVVDGILGSGTVMMEHVPLDAAAYPGTQHTYILGLDYGLAVENLISVGLVRGIQEAAADIRKNAYLDIVVLQIQRPVGAVHLFQRRIVIHSVGINSALGPLVGEIPLKQRGFFRSLHSVGGKVDGSLPHLYRSILRRGGHADHKYGKG